MRTKQPRIVFVAITCEGCKKRYSAGVNFDTLPETLKCPGCGTEIEVVRASTDRPADGDATRATGHYERT
jgi:ribosomal protein S27E